MRFSDYRIARNTAKFLSDLARGVSIRPHSLEEGDAIICPFHGAPLRVFAGPPPVGRLAWPLVVMLAEFGVALPRARNLPPSAKPIDIVVYLLANTIYGYFSSLKRKN